MKKVGIAILGLGVVGSGTYKILTEHREDYKNDYNVDIVVENVLEMRPECVKELGIDENTVVSNIAEICSNPEVDIVVEVMGGIEPAKTYILAALNAGKSVVTSNKELFCKYSHELEKAARHNRCGLFYGATCVGGVPVVRTLLDNLQGNKITSITGIVNGPTNCILSKMSNNGLPYGEALKEIQSLGYDEAEIASDVEGYDAVYKLSILSSLAFHKKIPYTKIYREGITDIGLTDIEYGKKLGYVIKLLAIGKNGDSGIEVRVHPAFVKNEHPLASVNNSNNAVYISGDCVGDVMLYGPGAGAQPAGSAIVGDIIYCATHISFQYSPFKNTEDAHPTTKFKDNFESAYYIRIDTQDKTGALAKITSIFSRCGVGIEQMIQGDTVVGAQNVPVIFITHKTKESHVNKAVAEINATADIARVIKVIRVAD